MKAKKASELLDKTKTIRLDLQLAWSELQFRSLE